MSGYVNVDAEVARMFKLAGTPRLSNGIAVDIEHIVRHAFDLDVAYISDLNIRGKRALGALVPQQQLLLVEAGHIVVRRRFTIAHECGHLLLHYKNAGAPSLFPTEYTSVYRCEASDVDERAGDNAWHRRREILANKFAARALMPASLCRELFKSHRSLDVCADLLQVSREACRIRFAELHLRPAC